MKYETKRTIVNVTAGVAIAGALAAGIAFGGPAIKNSIQYNNTSVIYNDSNYVLKDLYLLTNKTGETTLCYAKEIDNETEIKFGPGFSLGNGFMTGMNGGFGFSTSGSSNPGSITMGFASRPKTTYGYITLDSNELIAIRGDEEEFGYIAEPFKSFIPFEVAKEKGFVITNEELYDLLPITSGKSK